MRAPAEKRQDGATGQRLGGLDPAWLPALATVVFA
jgi:hypothetical protein